MLYKIVFNQCVTELSKVVHKTMVVIISVLRLSQLVLPKQEKMVGIPQNPFDALILQFTT